MSNDSDVPPEITQSELVRKIRIWIAHQKRTAERDQYLSQLFPEGIDICEEEKVVMTIRQHFPEVSREAIYSMNPGQIGVYVKGGH